MPQIFLSGVLKHTVLCMQYVENTHPSWWKDPLVEKNDILPWELRTNGLVLSLWGEGIPGMLWASLQKVLGPSCSFIFFDRTRAVPVCTLCGKFQGCLARNLG